MTSSHAHQESEVNPKLLDEARVLKGFPKGDDVNLLQLSDPPQFTAYPNPGIKEFVKSFGKPYQEENDNYTREPYVGDITEARSDPVYNAVSYHTKVPHKAIMKFISHYTDPNDLVLDVYCGTGMTGVAAQALDRRAILTDLCPIATFISYNLNLKIDYREFEESALGILAQVEEECGWLYRTVHSNGKSGVVDFTVWSDVFQCPYCKEEFPYWEVAVNEETGKVLKDINCPRCNATVDRRELTKVLNREGMSKQVPVLVSYKFGDKRFERKPSGYDLELIKRIDSSEIPYWFPRTPMMFVGEKWGDTWRAGYHAGIRNTDDFYTKRNMWILSSIHDKISKVPNGSMRRFLMMWFESQIVNVSKLNRFRRVSFPYNPLSGTLYVSSTVSEANVITAYRNKVKRLVAAKQNERCHSEGWLVSTQSATDLSNIPESSIDYIFIDPPFGDNLMYSELNFLYEAWLRVFTNTETEAIINQSQGKGLSEYRELMLESFRQMYTVLKPNRWITVEFHNSKASVWNAIQESLARAGFVIAQVVVLDKVQGSFKQVTAEGAVKNDLVINAYKPRTSFVKAFLGKAGSGLESEFIQQHLKRLPVSQNVERTEQMLYSKVLAYYVQHGYQINMNSKEFYSMLRQSFEERDGFWFLESQVESYEKRKLTKDVLLDQTRLFISDEQSAIQWLYLFLDKPKGYDEIYPEYIKNLTATADTIPELKELLAQNFISTNGAFRRPELIEKEEIEEKRLGRLLHTFDEYYQKASRGGKLENVRKDAILIGFRDRYQQRRFQDILAVAAKLSPEIIESSTEIYDLIDVARTKVADSK